MALIILPLRDVLGRVNFGHDQARLGTIERDSLWAVAAMKPPWLRIRAGISARSPALDKMFVGIFIVVFRFLQKNKLSQTAITTAQFALFHFLLSSD